MKKISTKQLLGIVSIIGILGAFWLFSPAATASSHLPAVQDVVGNVTAANGFRYGARDSAWNTMDTVKIIDNPAGGYLGVYHAGDVVKLAASTNLVSWNFVVNLDSQATQPTIQALPTGGFLVAMEYNDQAGSGGTLRLKHYPTLSALYDGSFDRETTLPRTLSACNEGTPNFYSVALNSDIDNSVIDMGFHYHKNCSVDRQARGILTNFTTWNTVAEAALDQTLKNATYAVGQSVGGNIGDRDRLLYGDNLYNLHEVQYLRNDFGSWRTYLYDWQTNLAEYLPITTHGGSMAFANPTFTNITAPSGNPAVVSSMFVPSQGSAPGEGGPLIYYRELTANQTPAQGLNARYYENRDFTGSNLGKADPQVNFFWGTGEPASGFGGDDFSVRWTGKVTPAYNQTYTFYTQTDDGVRLWVNGVQLVNAWQDSFLGMVKEKKGTIALTAGQQYDIKMEYYERSGNASAKLLWSSPSVAKQIIPTQALTVQ